MTQSSTLFACCGEAASQWSKASRTVVSTIRAASTVASLSLVWPWNSGSRMNTDSIEAQVAMTSSVVTAVMRFAWPTRSACSRKPRSSAMRMPLSCVPPSGVGMVLQ